MKCPNFEEEKKLWKQGFKCVVGLDEAGRGPLAGPVVAGAVLIKANSGFLLKGINDSKKLSERQRESLYKILTNSKNIKWGIGIVSEKVIDKINILEASKLAMQKAVVSLNKKIKKFVFTKMDGRRLLEECEFLLIDGNFKVNSIACLRRQVQQKSIIKGDQKVVSISAASIIAKVTRDRIMEKFHKKYPQYGFNKHKGYGTALHTKMIKKYGPCKIHRKSFYPASVLKIRN